ncbi:hypothetical protein BgiBS90_005684, partial [Biomphalaria glabrata]
VFPIGLMLRKPPTPLGVSVYTRLGQSSCWWMMWGSADLWMTLVFYARLV